MNGTITVIDAGPVRVHSYMAPDDSLNVTTQRSTSPTSTCSARLHETRGLPGALASG